jgi:leucyl aminopeptidase
MKIHLRYEPPQKVKTDLLVVILDNRLELHDLGRSPLAATVEGARRNIRARRLLRPWLAPLGPRSAAAHLLVDSTSFDPAQNVWEQLKTSVACALRTARELGLKRVAVVLNTRDAVPMVGKAVEGALLGTHGFATYKKESADRQEYFDKMRLDLITLKEHDAENKRHLDRYTRVSDAVNLARDLINEPGSVVTPERLAAEARRIAAETGLDCTVQDPKQLEKNGFTGLLQVGQGSAHKPCLICLSYKAPGAARTLALVGKGVTFDTGGISLKPADKMWEMKGDMSGGAAVLAAMKAIGQLKPGVNVVGIVPAAENSPDANAQRPGDIFRARNGKTIMVDNTDAEGRLILTDGLSLAGDVGATHIVDIATLTGACVRALGPSIAGVMGNDADLIQAVIRSGQNHGESYWELPLPEEYKEMLKTPNADLNNIGGIYAGALTAGLFLQEFVPEGARWAHLDIAGPFMRDKNWKYYEPGGIGFGAKTLVDLAERFEDHFGSETGSSNG